MVLKWSKRFLVYDQGRYQVVMHFKQIIILILIMAVMAAGYFLLFPVKSVNHKIGNGPETNSSFDLNNNVQVQIRDMTNVRPEYYSGNSRFSQGDCQSDTECFIIGCSLEMCSSDKNLMTTCEIGGNFPDKAKYACGCVKDKCGWYLK